MEILKIGVTGSAGSGKSLVCKGFARLGLVTLDCDKIAREIVAPGLPAYQAVVSLFGQGVVGPDKNLDRAMIRRIIVTDPKMRTALEAILHPAIIQEMKTRMAEARYLQEKACAVEVPLLFELSMEAHFDVTLVVTADQKMLEERISQRDGVDEASARKILALQMSQQEKIRRADLVVYNTGDPSELFARLENLYGQLKKERLTKRG